MAESLVAERPQPVKRLAGLLAEAKEVDDWDVAIVIATLLLGLTHNTFSTDVLHLSVGWSETQCKKLGIPEETFRQVVEAYSEACGRLRSWQPKDFG